GFVLVEGDIQVPAQHSINGRFQPKATYTIFLWDNGVVPFVFFPNVSPENQKAMLDAMAVWEAVANVDFRPYNGEPNFVSIQNSTDNNSPVGMVGGMQIINIFNWDKKFIMAHELGHCLGLLHEQNRADRNQYVQINEGNVQDKQYQNFALNLFP